MAAFDQNTNNKLFSDRHAQPATGVGLPVVDAEQNAELIELSEANGITTLQFRRKLNTCDRDDYVITSGTTRVLFAYHTTDKPIDDFTILTTAPHTFRTSRSIDLLQSSSRVVARPSDYTLVFDVRFNNTVVPGGERTRYWWTVTPSTWSTKMHLVGVEPLIPANELLTSHHIVVYRCTGLSANDTAYVGDGYLPTTPRALRKCQGRSPVHVWAVGSGALYYPPNGKAKLNRVFACSCV